MNMIVVSALVALSFVYGLAAHFSIRQAAARAQRTLLTLIFISLTIWSGSLAVSVAAHTRETALVWRRLSALGWGTVYAFLLHLLLLISGRQNLLRKPFIYILLYAPPLSYVFIYLFYSAVANQQFNLQYMDGMWVNLWANTAFNWGYTLYYTLFLLASIAALYRWRKNTKIRAEARRALMLLVLITLALLSSLVMNTLLQHSGLGLMIAQTVVLIALLPILASVQRQVNTQAEQERPEVQAGHVLSMKARMQIYRIAGLSLFVLSYLSFYTGAMNIPVFVLSTSHVGNIILGLLLLVAAQIIYSLNRTGLSIKKQEVVLLLVFTVVDLFLFIRFASIGAITVWASIIIIIMVGVVFNNVSMVMLAGSLHILLMVVFAFLYPVIETSINIEDHAWRVMMVAAAMALAYVVNRAYKRGLQENDDYARMQENISQLALLLSEGNLTEYAQRITQSFEIAREYLDPDQLLVLKEPDSLLTSRALQIRPLPSLGDLGNPEMIAALRWVTDQDGMGSVPSQVCMQVSQLPPQRAHAKQLLVNAGVSSLLLSKLSTPDKARSLLLLTSSKHEGSGKNLRNQDFVATFSNLLTGFVSRACAETELLYLAYHDNLTGLLKRERFLQLADEALAACMQKPGSCGLVFLDMNGFKQVNDQGGHALGDQVLRDVAVKLRQHSQADDLVGRFGGDEFLVLLNRRTEEKLTEAALALKEALVFSVEQPPQRFHISASCGLAIAHSGVSSMESLLHDADAAMYRDKALHAKRRAGD